MTQHLITSRTDWTPEILREIYSHIEDVAVNDLKLDVYPNQIEVISAEQMIDAYASNGSPINYHHWSFGKEFLKNWNSYQKGKMGLAYEIVINTNPCISYLMEENNACTQALVMAHAAFGHNSVFKNNYLFKEWTSADSINDYMIFAKNFIKDCEQKYGEDEVERVLDAAHAISLHGVDKRRRRHVPRQNEEQAALAILEAADEEQRNLDIILKKTSMEKEVAAAAGDHDLDALADEENILYFIYKNAPNMPRWKKEILRIMYKINQHYYPQRLTKTLNEGMATFTHFYIMDELERRGLLSPDAQLQWLQLHSSVIYQPDMSSPHYSGKFNPYALGFDILKEVRRICEQPTAEDREWFPNLVGSDWREQVKNAAFDYRDESFIEQFMSPALIRKYRMFSVYVNGKSGFVTEISDERGYQRLRSELASTYNPINYTPDISVRRATLKGDRMLTLEYKPYKGRSLHKQSALKTLKHIQELWGYDCEIITLDRKTNTEQLLLRI